jgi:hypothetical protein
LFWIIPGAGSKMRITLSLESISTVAFKARASGVKNPEWGQHCSNCRMTGVVRIFGTFRRTGDQPIKNPGVLLRGIVDIF